MNDLKITVIVAVEYSQNNLPEILNTILTSACDTVEVIIAYTSKDPGCPGIAAQYKNVVAIHVADGGRIPQMWAEGIRKAQGTLVALITAHCVPEKDWIHTMLALDMTDDLAGIGGIFRNACSASAMDWAIFLQRYRQFSAYEGRQEVSEIAADNAVYRKTALLACDDLLENGFWEPEFHTRFKQQGLRLVLDPSLVVVHRNCYTFQQFAAQRMEHGEAFGIARAAKLTLARNFAFLLISPALPLVFLSKIVSDTCRRKTYRVRTIQSLPWLFAFVACWGLGECRGYFREFSRRLMR